ncbi:MAG TPA: hypothetical protein VHE13_09175 [Opitutus sp.]|nr:hypothetical protein [Opitutus sp.]
MKRSHSAADRIRAVHPHAWLWEPLETEPTFVLRTMFGAKAVYLDGKIVLCFCTGEEPWRGILVATDRDRHAALLAEFPELAPHKFLSKWLYLPERADRFERTAAALVALVRRRDPRIGVVPQPKKSRRTSARRSARPPGHP